MAEKRMFSKTIVLSDAFLDMPMSARCLYFTLNMFADDDGFVGSPKGIMRQCGSSEDDMKILISKQFVLVFDSGVIVIRHWRINNYLRNDRYKPTTYVEEKAQLSVTKSGAYVAADSVPEIPILNELNDGIPSIDKNRIDKNSIDNIISAWNDIPELPNITKLTPSSSRYKSLVARIKEYSVDDVLKAIDNIGVSNFLLGKINHFKITFDWFVKPNNFPKVLEGNYNRNDAEETQADDNVPTEERKQGRVRQR